MYINVYIVDSTFQHVLYCTYIRDSGHNNPDGGYPVLFSVIFYRTYIQLTRFHGGYTIQSTAHHILHDALHYIYCT
jgi:hypothetical protein